MFPVRIQYVDHTAGAADICSVIRKAAADSAAALAVAKETLGLLKKHHAAEEKGTTLDELIAAMAQESAAGPSTIYR